MPVLPCMLRTTKTDHATQQKRGIGQQLGLSPVDHCRFMEDCFLVADPNALQKRPLALGSKCSQW